MPGPGRQADGNIEIKRSYSAGNIIQTNTTQNDVNQNNINQNNINQNQDIRQNIPNPNILNNREQEQVQVRDQIIADNEVHADDETRIIANIDKAVEKHVIRDGSIENIKQPSEKDILKAHIKVDIPYEQGEKKRTQRLAEANKSYGLQQTLLNKAENAKEVDEEKIGNMVAALENADLNAYIKSNEKESIEDFYINNYDKVRGALGYLDSYKRNIESKKLKMNELDDKQKKKLKESEAHLKALTDIKEYYDAVQGYILNKYYALLPKNKIRSLTYEELIIRLDQQYKNDPLNPDLIAFYQNLIRMRNFEDANFKDGEEIEKHYLEATKAEPEFNDTRDLKDEIKKITKDYAKLRDLMKRRKMYSQAEKQMYVKDFYTVYGRDIEAYAGKYEPEEFSNDFRLMYAEYQLNKTKEDKSADESAKAVQDGITEDEKLLQQGEYATQNHLIFSEGQKASMSALNGLILRRALRSTHKKENFAHYYLHSPFEQQLLTMYLIENGKQSQATMADVINALDGYVPDYDKIHKAISTFCNNTNWEVVSSAVNTAKSLGTGIVEYEELISETKTKSDEIENAKKEKKDSQTRSELLVDQIVNHGDMIRVLYGAAGLRPDMPMDMAGDPVIRQKIKDEHSKIVEIARQLDDMIKKDPNLKLRDAEYKDQNQAKVSKKAKAQSKTDTVLDYMGKAKDVMGIGKNIADAGVSAPAIFIDKVNEFQGKTSMFTSISTMYLGAQSLLALVASIRGTVKMWDKLGTLSIADTGAQTLSNVGGIVGNSQKVSTGIIEVLDKTGVVDKTLGATADASKVLGYIGVGAGSITLIAGGIQLGRSISSGNDIKRAKKSLNDKTGEYTADEKKLSRFLRNQERAVSNDEISAGVNILVGSSILIKSVIGAASLAAGPLGLIAGLVAASTGLLYGLYAGKKLRHNKRKEAVDEYLQVDRIMLDMKNKKGPWNTMNDKDLRYYTRKKVLGMLGYANYKECYKHICTEFAQLLYNKVLAPDVKDSDKDYNMYKDALESLGFKIKKAKAPDYKPSPAVATMVAKMMG
ncbi:MAG: hypothetical protein K6G12_02425 [Lachnospiraceae bacterium]|nr:hypothetical protein [Lachnospiraceae bacterium]